ncbi:hypothetical protein [Propylenella binzhouense]|uniref:ATP synthase subunit b n=1 Tax=Propylenella binzhouense TaxID=2555902 RepID=A0A964T6E2_9HYPH|nr:hypothetical protein [Propylenella binzhouense]MYZ48970.1 hypothetical protein [Propylenella binzhouense]
MRIDWWTIGLQTVNVLVLVWILSRFLFRPIAGIVAARQAETAKLMESARAARAAADREREAAAAERGRIAASRSDQLKSAAAEGDREKTAILAAARAEAEKLRSEAEAEIAKSRKAADAEAEKRASRLAVDIAGKLLARLPREAQVTPFVDGLAEALSKLPPASRASLDEPGAILVKAPRALDAAETAALGDALGRALGRKPDIRIETDAALIAGLELEAPHAIVRNSLRADLDRIAGALTGTGAGHAG